jgi:hypothetical protein
MTNPPVSTVTVASAVKYRTSAFHQWAAGLPWAMEPGPATSTDIGILLASWPPDHPVDRMKRTYFDEADQ